MSLLRRGPSALGLPAGTLGAGWPRVPGGGVYPVEMIVLIDCTGGGSTPGTLPTAHTALLPARGSDAWGELLGVEDSHWVAASAVPTRSELRFLDELPGRYVQGSVPSLEEIARQPDVAHQGQPQPAPHRTSERVRVIVAGTDAALAAVATKLMRIDALWMELAYVPADPASAVATLWGLGAGADDGAGDGAGNASSTADPQGFPQLRFALARPALPTALIRDDQGVVTLGAAEITDAQGAELVGEVIVDSEVLYSSGPGGRRAGTTPPGTGHRRGAPEHPGRPAPRSGGRARPVPGVRLVPTTGMPGIAAVQMESTAPTGFFARLKHLAQPQPEVPLVLQGRALQAGGPALQLVRDGARHPRPLKAVTFYRHLRDGQFVRN